ncbi:hypothetical protein NP570_24530, partial [Vibrio parahaemolyticus]|nr:hypothetical protein [Vibrio parahaemolyticus]
GVVILPISSGDTEYRATRLNIAEYLKLEEKTILISIIIEMKKKKFWSVLESYVDVQFIKIKVHLKFYFTKYY